MTRSKSILVFLIFFVLLPGPSARGQLLATQSDSFPGNFFTVEKVYINSTVDGYNIYIPKSCTPDSKKFPVIVFLQGGLGVGGRVDVIYNWELPKTLLEIRDFNSELNKLRLNTFVIIMPHLSDGQFYDKGNDSAMSAIIKEVSDKYNVDIKRIYLTGISRGGHGAWGLACRMPGKFAAIAPISGNAEGINDYGALKDIPIWTSHNVADDVVNYSSTFEIVYRIEQLSDEKFLRANRVSDVAFDTNDRIFISGKNKSHDAWTALYDNPGFYKWLLKYSIH
jgi:predicted peptidase